MKYGVVSMNSLCADLLDWRTLYLAGRLQKPTALIRDNPRVRLANQVNHASAIRTALLLLPERFTPQELFMNVAGLSYMGDPRMGLAENPDKVRNIVNGPGQLEAFRRMYSPFLPHSQLDGQLLNRNWSQDNSPVAKAELAHKLPATLREILWRQFVARGVVPSITTSSDPDAEKELWARIIQHEDFDTAIRSCMSLH